MKIFVSLSLLMLSGCAAVESSESVQIQREHRERIIVSKNPMNEMRPAKANGRNVIANGTFRQTESFKDFAYKNLMVFSVYIWRHFASNH